MAWADASPLPFRPGGSGLVAHPLRIADRRRPLARLQAAPRRPSRRSFAASRLFHLFPGGVEPALGGSRRGKLGISGWREHFFAIAPADGGRRGAEKRIRTEGDLERHALRGRRLLHHIDQAFPFVSGRAHIRADRPPGAGGDPLSGAVGRNPPGRFACERLARQSVAVAADRFAIDDRTGPRGSGFRLGMDSGKRTACRRRHRLDFARRETDHRPGRRLIRDRWPFAAQKPHSGAAWRVALA
ncbi:MAG: hypothetical protein BWZ10_01902 [candidate division BRC1 bacterium ADurb.BinA364]|nr:MAG: hypothetical protein BWZ10_01902 [candidate division BRC1 bacterium ADurb.BinA364]